MLGLAGEDPETCDTDAIPAKIDAIVQSRRIVLNGVREVPFDPALDLVFHRQTTLPFHPNGMTFSADFEDGPSHSETYYSIGGGFITQEGQEAQWAPGRCHVADTKRSNPRG